MTFKPCGPRRFAAWLICLCMLLPFLQIGAGAQQKRRVVVRADQPNLWTLEQAHYLLAQMHRRNLDLRAKKLEDLDPNEINGLRFDVMRMLIEFGATFNQADLQANNLLTANQSFNSERRQKLLDDRTRLSDESVRLSGEIRDLQIEKTDTQDADEKKRLDEKIAATTAHQARVDKQVESIDAELKTLNAPSGTPTATTGGATFDANKLPKSTFDKAFEDAAAKQIGKFNEEGPRLNATLRLDNFLQMQYEIIAKQLSLLRDELGPGERLVFLELPQTVNASHHEADRKWAQSWWKIAGYTRREAVMTPAVAAVPAGPGVAAVAAVAAAPAPPADPTPTPYPIDLDQQPITVTQDYNSIFNGSTESRISLPVACSPTQAQTFSNPAPFKFGDAAAAAGGKVDSSAIKVSATGRVTDVTVTLNGLHHPTPQNLDLMLVGPQGQNALIMSDVGANNPARGLTITLDDAATATGSLPAAASLQPGTFLPTNNDASSDAFPNTGPTPLGGSALSVFDGTNPNGTWTLYALDDTGGSAGRLDGGWSLNLKTDCAPSRPRPMEVKYEDKFVNLDDQLPNSSTLHAYMTQMKDTRRLRKFENRTVRTVELIPRQSSLNVNDMNLKVKAGAFNFVLSTLFGFGSRLNIQRQREQFSQFVQQELYSSAFGKGAREFGWTFMPMPGTDRLMSGVRTTYAVVVVPEDATSLVLESNGCYFPRSQYQPGSFDETQSPEWNVPNRSSRNCDGTEASAFVVPIPSANIDGTNNFWVNNISFQPVSKGKRIVVNVSGKNFSPQTGVLINGFPLLPSVGLAQPLMRDDSDAGRLTRDEFKDAEVVGSVERVDSHRIIFSFKMPADFQGTPTITLIAPGRAIDLNWLKNVSINGDPPGTQLKDYSPKMFTGPTQEGFRIDRVRVTRGAVGRLIAQVSGAGFGSKAGTAPAAGGTAPVSDAVAKVFVNGSEVTAATTFRSPSLLTVEFAAPRDETIKVTLVSKNDEDPKKVLTVESDAVSNPTFLSVSDVEVTVYETEADDEPATLLVKIKGTGFTDSLKASIEGKNGALPLAVKSATEAVLTMPDPQAAAIVILEDDAGQKAKLVITRKTKKQ